MAQLPAKIEVEHGPPVLFADYTLDSWMVRFLSAFAECGIIAEASRRSKINPCYHYKWVKTNSEYSMAYREAEAIFVSSMAEGAFVQRGIFGYKKQLSYKGKLTGDETTEYSDVLAQSYMKAHDPRYRDGQQIAVGPAKISIEITQGAGDLKQSLQESNTIEVNLSSDLSALENKVP